jgi:hypothetical protein
MPDDLADDAQKARAEQPQQQPHFRVKDAQQLYDQDADPVKRILQLELDNARLELQLERANNRIERMKKAPKWLQPVGIGFGVLTFLFLGLIVILSIVGYVVPPTGKFSLVGFMAFGSAFSAAAWIGDATLSGNISPDSNRPLILSASGGFAVFALVFFFGYWFYIR